MLSLIRRWYLAQYGPEVPLPHITGFPAECPTCLRLLRARYVLRLMTHLCYDHHMDPIASQELAAFAGGRFLGALTEHRRKQNAA
jgi:hypothetical protein